MSETVTLIPTMRLRWVPDSMGDWKLQQLHHTTGFAERWIDIPKVSMPDRPAR